MRITILLITSIVLLYSCKKETTTTCNRECTDSHIVLYFPNHTYEELNNVEITTYKQGSFTERINKIGNSFHDTVVNGSNKYVNSNAKIELSPNYNYEVYLPAIQKTYRISEIQQTKPADLDCSGKYSSMECHDQVANCKIDGEVYTPENFYYIALKR